MREFFGMGSVVSKAKRQHEMESKSPAVQTGRSKGSGDFLGEYQPLYSENLRLYDSIRQAVPIVDAALDKIVHLVGGFKIVSSSKEVQNELETFLAEVQIGAGQRGIGGFLHGYLDSLLTYGNAVGEIIPDNDYTGVLAVYNSPLENIQVKQGENMLQPEFYAAADGYSFARVPCPELILFTPLRPRAGQVKGQSILAGIPFVADILMKIFNSVGNNFDRTANLRYAVTYKPTAGEQGSSKEIATAIAREWGSAMDNTKNGRISDFVAVGDVEIKVIGADNQMPETEVPVRQLLEQIVSKLGIPPFLLGLHWSSTERMSALQTDILTSEMEYYRGILTPIVERICTTHLRLRGITTPFAIDWDMINLQDETDIANARYVNAQAAILESDLEVE